MVYNSKLSIGFLDVVIRGFLLNTKDFVVVLPFALLELELCVPNIFRYAWL